MEQVFRIEIPIEAVDETDTATLQRLETTLQKLFTAIKGNKNAADDVFDAIEKGALDAKTAINQTDGAFEGMTSELDDAADAAEDMSDALDDTASSARTAGQSAGTAFNSANTSVDKFSQRMEKSNKTLRDMFNEKLSLTLSAIDRASPVLKNVWNSAKNLAGKTWNVAVRMKDFITAPFRKLWNLISSPVTMALSVVGMGMSVSDVLNTFNGFEEGMSGVRALTDATDDEFLVLRETAKSLGASTSFSASQAAEGMQNLASAGFSVNEIVEAMPGMLDLAASSGESLASASDIAATTLRGFGLEASKAGHVADVLAEVAARTNASVSDTGEAMKYIAPVANAMNLSLEEVAASIGLLSDSGIKGSQAGTTLRSALTRLAKPTEDMSDVMDQLGLSFYDVDGNMKSISTIVGMLNMQMADLTAEQKQNALVTLFGQEALSGMMVLMEAGPEKIAELTQSLTDCEGAAEKMSKVRLDNLSGDIEELSGAMETMQLDVMEKLNPILRSAVQWLTGKMPSVQSTIENAIDSGIEKAEALKSRFEEVFDSVDFQNADGFAEKFFVAWDKIVAEPFDKWWSGGGREEMLGKLADFGEGAGEMLNGLVTGVLAAITGKDIDFEGLNITGLAKAGAEAGKTFISSFMGGLNVGDLFGKLPGLVKFGALGFGAFKAGSGIVSTINTFSALKNALFGVGSAATVAGPAVASVGKGVAASAVGLGKGVTLLGGLKTVLSAIPGWGWVAAAAITAAVIGVKTYTAAQEEQRWALKRSSEATAESIDEYREAARAYTEFSDSIDRVKELQLKIESNNTNPQTAEYVQGLMDSIEDKTAQIEVIMSSSSLTPEQVGAYTDELVGIYTRRAEIEVSLGGASMTTEQVTALKNEIEGIQSRKAEIEAKIAEGGLSVAEISTLQREYNSLSDRKAEIELLLSGQSLSQEELGALAGELEQINNREAEITAEMSAAGMTEDQIGEVAGLLNEIGDRNAALNISLAEGSLGTKELQELNDELQSAYQHMIDTSGGVVTQADVDAGRVTPEYLEAYQEHMRIQEETALFEAQASANADAELVPQTVSARDEAFANYEAFSTMSDARFSEKNFLQGLEDKRANLLSQYEAGVISQDELFQGGYEIRESWKDYYGGYEQGPGSMLTLTPDLLFGTHSLFGGWKPEENDFFQGAIDEVNRSQSYTDEMAASYLGDYQKQNSALQQNYQNQVGLIEGWTFQGSELAGMSLEEVASSYATLDDAGRQMFDDAVNALNALNQQTDYLTEGEKTQALDVVDLAAKAEIVSMVQQQVQTIATDYQTMTAEQQASFAASEEGAAQLAAVNEALAGLGLEQIESLDQLNTALESLGSVDLSSFSLAEVQTAFTAVGGDASAAQTKVDSLRSSLDAIDGMSTTSTHTHTNLTVNRTITVGGGKVSVNAEGGIYDGAMLSWVAEDGPEAIIPLGAKRRDRGIDLWLAAGEMLGISQLADGGIISPYAGAIESLPDDTWGDDGDDSPDTKPIHVGDHGSGTGPISISVAANPVFHVEGGDSSDDILAKIKAKQAEIAEVLGGAIADQLEDILTNMA